MSVTSGTALHGVRLPLTTVVYAIWCVAGRKQSISALQLQKDCRIGSYESAWLLLHKVRRALKERAGDPLHGVRVEVDEPLVGHGDGVRPPSHRTRVSPVALGIERWRGSASGRLRMAAHCQDVEVTSTFILEDLGNQEASAATGLLARTVAANLSAWLSGTFHGVSQKYLFAYLREFVFRFNRRRHEQAASGFVATALLCAGPCRAKAIRTPTELEYPLSP